MGRIRRLPATDGTIQTSLKGAKRSVVILALSTTVWNRQVLCFKLARMDARFAFSVTTMSLWVPYREQEELHVKALQNVHDNR